MMGLNLVRISSVIVIAGLAAGCAGPTWTSPAGTRDYQIGYHDGCDSGYAVAGSPFYQRIEEASPPEEGSQYFLGWTQGYQSCKTSYDRIQNVIHSVLGT